MMNKAHKGFEWCGLTRLLDLLIGCEPRIEANSLNLEAV